MSYGGRLLHYQQQGQDDTNFFLHGASLTTEHNTELREAVKSVTQTIHVPIKSKYVTNVQKLQEPCSTRTFTQPQPQRKQNKTAVDDQSNPSTPHRPPGKQNTAGSWTHILQNSDNLQ